ncbi:hypothetical protein [Desulfovibrio sp. JC010]|uniref:hypothetical protein n=1 Tax=Desulfovibrio sp. JC010 TaxID=2593641 RepID=UPI0013D4AB4B|nr:hypothetical protein [Desulfovibrio sp. JC010]NDV25431.1 hypothetical protein [Desulfovibrio sp. JC010]
MIDKATALESVLRKLKKLPVGHCIDLRTYKRNRSLLILHVHEQEYIIYEDGYEKIEHQTALKGMKKLLKTLFKREFPRSNKIRMYELGEYNEQKHRREMKKL